MQREAEQMSLLESCPQRHVFSQCLPRSPSLGVQAPLGWKPLWSTEPWVRVKFPKSPGKKTKSCQESPRSPPWNPRAPWDMVGKAVV